MKLFDVIKYEGDNSTFIWKHPCEDFNTDSVLIVHESQEALLLRDGKILHKFLPGSYSLNTQNIPIIRNLINLPTGGVSAFHCELYFVNKVQQMAITWGTPNKLQYLDPICGFPISIGASGAMAISVADGEKLLLSLVGTEQGLERDKLVSYFRAFLMTKVKVYIAREMKRQKINIFEVDENLEEFSKGVKLCLQPDFLNYGLNLTQFFITTIVKPEDDTQFQKYRDLYFKQYADIIEAELRQKVDIIDQETQTTKMLIASEGMAKKRLTEGYTYQQERSFDVAMTAAGNEGSAGNIAGLGIGLGMMSGMGATIGGTFNNALKSTIPEILNPQICKTCGNPVSLGEKYCTHCGGLITQTVQCEQCGLTVDSSCKYCPNCGAKLGEAK